MNLTYCAIDFAKDNLIDGLRRIGFREDEKTFYVWEGVCMYLSEENVRKTLQMIASHSVPGSSLVLDYANRLGIEAGKLHPTGPGGIPSQWEEPWIFGVPGDDGNEFFQELGFDPGMPLSTTHPEIIQRYGTRQDGTSYASHIFKKMWANAQTQPVTPPSGSADAQKAITSTGGANWFTELTVLDPRKV